MDQHNQLYTLNYDDVLTNASSSHMYFGNKKRYSLHPIHRAHFTAMADSASSAATLKAHMDKIAADRNEYQFRSLIGTGPVVKKRSFAHMGEYRHTFPVYCAKPGTVPYMTDNLFRSFGTATSEFDILYRNRALLDAVSINPNKNWIWNTQGRKKKFTFRAYDIENFERGVRRVDMMGWTDIEFTVKSTVDYENAEFDFDLDVPSFSVESYDRDFDFQQIEAPAEDDELQLLLDFIKNKVDGYSGHNIFQYDNPYITERLRYHQNIHGLPQIDEFLKHTEISKQFMWGQMEDITIFYPNTFDTFVAERFAYDMDASLKNLAKFCGVDIPDREYLAGKNFGFNPSTRKYHKEDVIETVGVTLNLLYSCLPLSFMFCMPLDQLISSTATIFWDNLMMQYATNDKIVIPPKIKARGAGKDIYRSIRLRGEDRFKDWMTDAREQEVKRAKEERGYVARSDQTLEREGRELLSKIQRDVHKEHGLIKTKDIVAFAKSNPDYTKESSIYMWKLAKYGMEMPTYAQTPELCFDGKFKYAKDHYKQNFHIPGGNTLHPGDLGADFIPWFDNIVADVGCLVRNTQVITPEGPKNIGAIRKGSQVLTDIGFQKVIDKRRFQAEELLEIVTETGKNITCTADHKFPRAVMKGNRPLAKIIVEASSLEEGDCLLEKVDGVEAQNQVVPIKSIDEVGGDVVYDITVEDQSHPYFYANGILTHNSMYPTLLRCRNVGGEAVRYATNSEKPDSWVWFKEFPSAASKFNILTREPNMETESFTEGEGIMVGIIIDHRSSCVSRGMKAILANVTALKRKIADAEEDYKQQPTEEKNARIVLLKAMYKSFKAKRNAGTHGILSASAVSCRQFNIWGGAEITTKGQMILDDAFNRFKKHDFTIVYGDSARGERPIIVRKKMGLPRIVSLENFWEELSDNPQTKGHNLYKYPQNYEIMTMDDSGSLVWSSLSYITQHPYGEGVVRLATAQGDTVVTKQHSVFTWDRGPVELEAGDVSVGDKILVSNPPPMALVSSPQTVNLLDSPTNGWSQLNLVVELEPRIGNEWMFEHYVFHHSAGEQYRQDVTRGIFKPKKIRLELGDALRFYEKGLIETDDLKKGFLTSRLGDSKTPLLIPMNQDFAALLGYFMAEGSSSFRMRGSTPSADIVWVNNQEGHILQSVKEKLESVLGFKANITAADNRTLVPVHRVIGGGTPAYYLLHHILICGKNSSDKRASHYILGSPFEVKKSFFECAMEGDGHTNKDSRYKNPIRSYTTKSAQSVSAMALLGSEILNRQPSIDFRQDKQCYRVRFVQSYRSEVEKVAHHACLAEVTHITKEPSPGMVYDVCVPDNHRFLDAVGMVVLHNTDGIYVGTKSYDNSGIFGELQEANEDTYLDRDPKEVVKVVNEINRDWRKWLDYEDFEFEAEPHDFLFLVAHKNYFMADRMNDGSIKLTPKGANFKGESKSPITRNVLKPIVEAVGRDLSNWSDIKTIQSLVKSKIKKTALAYIKDIRDKPLDLEDLVMVQKVKNPMEYEDKKNRKRAEMIYSLREIIDTRFKDAEQDEEIDEIISEWEGNEDFLSVEPGTDEEVHRAILSSHMQKVPMVVTKEPIGAVELGVKKSASRPLWFLTPVELVKLGLRKVDQNWYIQSIKSYVRGAFNLDDLDPTNQRTLFGFTEDEVEPEPKSPPKPKSRIRNFLDIGK